MRLYDADKLSFAELMIKARLSDEQEEIVERWIYEAAIDSEDLPIVQELSEKLRAAERDLEAIMWYSGEGCDICAHKVEIHKEPYLKLECALGHGSECRPKWRGADK